MLRPGQYFCPGKLLISAEYAVLQGAKALAVPTKLGQHLKLSRSDAPVVKWKVQDERDNTLFEGEFNEYGQVLSSTSLEWASRISKLLGELSARGVPLKGSSWSFHRDHPASWGLGTSASMIANVAHASGLDPMELFFASQTGSGYDVAVSYAKSALLYALKDGNAHWQETVFKPPFVDALWLVYSGVKQESEKEVKAFVKRTQLSKAQLIRCNELTQRMYTSQTLASFSQAIAEHELLIGELLDRKPVKRERFPDFDGQIKSLGAWGGDFLLVAAEGDVRPYFHQRGLTTVLAYTELVDC